jgi:hypothetical protein
MLLLFFFFLVVVVHGDNVNLNGDTVDWEHPLFHFNVSNENSTIEMTRDAACWNTTSIGIWGHDSRQQRVWGPVWWDLLEVVDLGTDDPCSTLFFWPFGLPATPESFVMQVDAGQFIRFKFHREPSSSEAVVNAWLFLIFLVVVAMVLVVCWGCLDETRIKNRRGYYEPVPRLDETRIKNRRDYYEPVPRA